MPTPLQEVGTPTVGNGITLNRQCNGENNRVITRRFRMRLEDQAYYIAQGQIIAPTLYDSVYTKAVIVDQRLDVGQDTKADAILVRVFAELPTPFDDFVDEAVTFPAVLQSRLYAPIDFRFRSSSVSRRGTTRLRHEYFLSNPSGIPKYPLFKIVDAQGVEIFYTDDNSYPSTDEYIAMVSGQQEIVVSSVPRQWQGDIWVLDTRFVVAQ